MKKTLRILALSIVMAGCSSAIDEQGYTHDPLEGMNRVVFAFNDTVDRFLLRPVAKGYDFIFPSPIKKGVSNFFGNIGDVRSFGNAILQLDGKASMQMGARIITNTIFGIGGLFDVATPMGNTRIEKDFGSTLARYGVKSGPFIMLPLLGPSTLRDGIGRIPDTYMNPISYIDDDAIFWSAIVLDAVQKRASLLPLDEQLNVAPDKYVMMRDSYLQHRWAQLEGKAVENTYDDAFQNTDASTQHIDTSTPSNQYGD